MATVVAALKAAAIQPVAFVTGMTKSFSLKFHPLSGWQREKRFGL